ncbi:MAG: hypothetical protein ABW199_12155 [Caulobacterales bacterium]
MKIDEVPQDTARTYGGTKKLLYAVDENGEYTGVNSAGWEVETYATMAAVEQLNLSRADAYERAKAGKTSPLEFHVLNHRMDLDTVSAATGLWKFRVRRHFRPDVFAKLPDSILQRYASVLHMNIGALRQLPDTLPAPISS